LGQALTTLELAQAVSKTIADELERDGSEFINIHRQCADIAVTLINVAIEALAERVDSPPP
jgi:hypothetical protein